MSTEIEQIRQWLKEVTTSALATTGPYGLNVVPVSVVDVIGEEIYLYDFFMNKTAKNIQEESQVALTCWKGFVGYQIKAEATYDSVSEVFETAVISMKQRFPDRTLRAVIRLKPVAIYDIAPTSGGENLLHNN